MDLLRDWGALVAGSAVSFVALLTTLAYLKHPTELTNLFDQVPRHPCRRALFTAHFVAVAMVGGLSAAFQGGGFTPPALDLLAGVWIVAGIAAIACAGIALVPWDLWVTLFHRTGRLWMVALAATCAVFLAGVVNDALWKAAGGLTFQLVKLLLSPLVQDVFVEPARMIIGTNRFKAFIAPGCSGLEGAGLLLVFGALYLGLFRQQLRFPHVLVLLPAGIVVLFLLNAVRIVVLILIGHAGAREIALGGFHAQAGWLAFLFVAAGFSIAARRLPWFAEPTAESLETTENPTAPYVIPFLMILSSEMISRAFSGNFEWFYGLRLPAAIGALWWYRKSYLEFPWKLSWLAPASGLAVFVLWVAGDWTAGLGPAGRSSHWNRVRNGVPRCAHGVDCAARAGRRQHRSLGRGMGLSRFSVTANHNATF